MSAGADKRNPWIGRITFLLYLVILAEVSSYFLIAVSENALGRPIPRVASVFERQTELFVAFAESRDGHALFDAELGWTYRPGFANGTDRMNGAGLRSDREYAVRAPQGTTRIAAFGDSFVYGTEVSNEGTWPAQLEALDPTVEALNYGIGGYGTDQAFLRFQRHAESLDADWIVIGFSPVSMRRIENVYRRFISTDEGPFVKPRFLVDDEAPTRLGVVPAPLQSVAAFQQVIDDPTTVRDWGDQDHWYEPWIYENPLHDYLATVRFASYVATRAYRRYVDPNRLLDGDLFNEASSTFRLQQVILEEFSAGAKRSGARPIVLILPDRDSIQRGQNGDRTVYAGLASALGEAGLEVWDGLEVFVESETALDALFMPGGHYSKEGNGELARWLLDRFRREASS